MSNHFKNLLCTILLLSQLGAPISIVKTELFRLSIKEVAFQWEGQKFDRNCRYYYTKTVDILRRGMSQ